MLVIGTAIAKHENEKKNLPQHEALTAVSIKFTGIASAIFHTIRCSNNEKLRWTT